MKLMNMIVLANIHACEREKERKTWRRLSLKVVVRLVHPSI
jgi:hypothetical protein